MGYVFQWMLGCVFFWLLESPSQLRRLISRWCTRSHSHCRVRMVVRNAILFPYVSPFRQPQELLCLVICQYPLSIFFGNSSDLPSFVSKYLPNREMNNAKLCLFGGFPVAGVGRRREDCHRGNIFLGGYRTECFLSLSHSRAQVIALFPGVGLLRSRLTSSSGMRWCPLGALWLP